MYCPDFAIFGAKTRAASPRRSEAYAG
jgi:hypothetical protein